MCEVLHWNEQNGPSAVVKTWKTLHGVTLFKFSLCLLCRVSIFSEIVRNNRINIFCTRSKPCKHYGSLSDILASHEYIFQIYKYKVQNENMRTKCPFEIKLCNKHHWKENFLMIFFTITSKVLLQNEVPLLRVPCDRNTMYTIAGVYPQWYSSLQ